MAGVHGKSASLLVNSFDLGAFLNDATYTETADEAEDTTWGSTFRSYVTGFQGQELTYDGIFTTSTSGSDEFLSSIFAASTNPTCTYYPNGDTAGRPAKLFQALENRYAISTPFDGVVSVAGGMRGTTAADLGLSIRALSTQGTTGSSTGVSRVGSTAASANGGIAHLHVTSFSTSASSTAADSVTVKVQHSSAAVSWTDLITFAAVTGKTVERSTVAGTVKRYVRVTNSAHTAGAGITYAVAFARR